MQYQDINKPYSKLQARKSHKRDSLGFDLNFSINPNHNLNPQNGKLDVLLNETGSVLRDENGSIIYNQKQ